MSIFATISGKIKKLEVNLEEITGEIDQQITVFDNTIKYIENALKEVSTKEKLQTITKIEKQELNTPLIKLKNGLDSIENNLNKLLIEIKTKENKLSEEEPDKLQQLVNELLAKNNDYKQKLSPLFDHIAAIQNQLATIKETLNPYDYAKEKDKFIKQLTTITERFNELAFPDPKQNQEILSQLKIFKHKVKTLSTSTIANGNNATDELLTTDTVTVNSSNDHLNEPRSISPRPTGPSL